MSSRFEQVKQLLISHYTAPLVDVFKQFRMGLAVFFVGMVMVYMAHQTMVPSLQQELMMLAALIIAGIGFLIAMTTQIRMLIIRVVSFFLDKP